MLKLNSRLCRAVTLIALLQAVAVRAANPDNSDEANTDPITRLLGSHKKMLGPGTGDMPNSSLAIPKDYLFTDGGGARVLLEAMGNISTDTEQGLLMSPDHKWFVVFEFNNDGYVKDDDKDKLNADKMLKAIQNGNEAANAERKRRGIPPLHVVGWVQPPRYNETTHNLEWATKAESEGHDIINYNTRLLGRRGVTEVTLVCKPELLESTLPQYQEVLSSFNYKAGETYAEYRQGDKVARYGLAALVLGGVAAGAAKLGLFTWLLVLLKKGWKLIAVACAAVASFFRKLFGGRRRQNE